MVSHAFSHGFRDDHTERLAAYWAEVLGGPATYSRTMGDESHVVRLHTGNGPHDEMDLRAVDCFAAALEDARVPETHHGELVGWFRDANQYVNHHFASPDAVPDALPMPVVGGSCTRRVMGNACGIPLWTAIFRNSTKTDPTSNS